MAVLFFGDSREAHLGKVAEMLRARGVETIVVDPDFLPLVKFCPVTFSLNVDSTDYEVDLAWFRIKASFSFHPERQATSIVLSDLEREAASLEWRQFGLSLWKIFRGRSLQDHHIAARFDAKPLQLSVAKSAGFSVPETIVTNNREYLMKTLSSDGKYVIKHIGTASVGDPYGESIVLDPVFLAREDVEMASVSEVQLVPSQYQKAIDKVVEYRVTAIGDRLFCCKYDLSDQRTVREDSDVDWRWLYSLKEPHDVKLPEELEILCRRYLKLTGLSLVSFDIAESRDGEYYFLEANPDGQWAWLDRDNSYFEAMVEYIVRRLQE